MNDNMKMLTRYAIAIAISYAAGKGWITPTQGDEITRVLIEVVGLLASFAPAIYAANKIDNSPK